MNTDKSILRELNQRKSVRAFSEDEIEKEKIEALIAAAQWAPSSRNAQEWHYYIFSGESREQLQPVLSRGNQWALKAPAVIAVTYDSSVENTDQSRDYGPYDTALSVMSLVVEAEHQGLRSHQMGGFDEDELRDVLKLAEKEKPMVMIAIGYEGNIDDLDERTKEKEMKRQRKRKSLNEVVTFINK